MQSHTYPLNHAINPENSSLLRQMAIRSTAMLGLMLLLMTAHFPAYAVEVTNAAGNTITTTADGAVGLHANEAGNTGATGIAINRGTIITSGNRQSISPQGSTPSFAIATGVLVWTHDGIARATNETSGVIMTSGEGAGGVHAYDGSSGNVVSINRGTITTKGDAHITTDINANITYAASADGISAGARYGTAQASNELGASIRTEGIGATGIHVHASDAATAINSGAVVTTGNGFSEYDSFHGATYASNADGVKVSSSTMAQATNETSGSIMTSGTGARGLQAGIDGSSTNSVAMAINRGVVMTEGDTFDSGSSSRSAYGVFAFNDAGGIAQASNEAGATVTTSGTGARGVYAWSEGGDASVTNSGTIITTGGVFSQGSTIRPADGAYAGSSGGDGAVVRGVNEAGATISTRGTGARGLQVGIDGGSTNSVAMAINRGVVMTEGDTFDSGSSSRSAYGVLVFNNAGGTAQAINEAGARVVTEGARASGVYASVYGSNSGTAVAINEQNGYIETKGERAYGLVAEASGDSAQATVRNKGQVITSGDRAEAVYAWSDGDSSISNPTISAYNDAGAMISASGTEAIGLGSYVRLNGRGSTAPVTVGGSVLARNDGTITVTNSGAEGVWAGYYVSSSDTSTTVASAGDVTLINTGNVTASGANATGLLAQTYGDGNAVISMTGGSVVAGAVGGTGILARVRDGTGNLTNGGDASISISGGNVSAVNGIGIKAQSGSGGTVTVMISDSTIDAVTAAHFSGGAAQFALSGSTLNGNVVFGAHSDAFTISDSTVNGNVDFGAGDDTLTFDISSGNSGRIDGDISNLETLLKRGAGDALVNNVQFTGSNVDIHEGRLVISGHLNVGSGTVTVRNSGTDTGQLTALIADPTYLPRITAGLIDFAGNADIYMQAMSAELASQTLAHSAASGLLTNTGMIMSGGTTADTVMLRSQTSSGSSSAIGSIAFDGDARTAIVSGTVHVDPVFGIATTGDGGDSSAARMVTVSNSGATTSTVIASAATDATVMATNEISGSIMTSVDEAPGLEAENEGIGNATAINRGTITTTGVDAEALTAEAQGGLAQAINEVGATITTSGAEAKGIDAETEGGGDATATNRGAVTTGGIEAHAVSAESGGLMAQATNETSGSIITSGAGAQGVRAEIKTGGSSDSVALAINRGVVITEGNSTFNTSINASISSEGVSANNKAGGLAQAINNGTVMTSGSFEARGVYAASTTNGTAVATNQVNGRVSTEGKFAFALWAGVDGGLATATVRNAGMVSTAGTVAFGVVAVIQDADSGTAEAINEAGATITTSGAGAGGLAGVVGSSNSGTTNAVAINTVAMAINRGSVMTQGDTYYSSGDHQSAHGVYALNEVGGTAQAINEAGATVTTSGTGAIGVYAESGDGDATATNSGTIITSGNGFFDGQVSLRAHGVFAYSTNGNVLAVNQASGRIETSGTGARGLYAWSESSDATATNRGSVTTNGDAFVISSTNSFTIGSADGVLASSSGSNGSVVQAINEASGSIITSGLGARGLHANIDTGGTTDSIAMAINRGVVMTSGDRFVSDSFTVSAHGVYALNQAGGTAQASNEAGARVLTEGSRAIGVYAFAYDGTGTVVATSGGYTVVYDDSGTAVATNEQNGYIETRGERAYGLAADAMGDSAQATVRNKGQVITSGDRAEAVYAWAIGYNSNSNAQVSAYNDAGAMISASGTEAIGLGSYVRLNGRGSTAPVTVGGSVLARNDGTITVTNSSAEGVWAGYYVSSSDTSTTVASAGDVTLINTGNVTASGANATGLLAQTYGDGNAVISMTGGSVVAGAVGGTGILARVRDGTGNLTNGGDASISISGGSVSAANGTGIQAQSGSGGTVAVTISDGAVITAETAAYLSGGAAQLSLSGSTLSGNVVFGAANDMLMFGSGGNLSGNVDFGAGEDTLTFNVSSGNSGRITGDISNLETLVKRGAGDALVNNVAFSDSNVDIQEGRLVISGHLNVGTNGTVTVRNSGTDTGQLTALIADPTYLPRITAGLIDFAGNADIYMQAMSAELASQTLAQSAATGLLAETGMIMSAGTAADTVTLMTTAAGGDTRVGSIDVSGATRVATVSGTIAVDPVFGIATTGDGDGGGGDGGATRTVTETNDGTMTMTVSTSTTDANAMTINGSSGSVTTDEDGQPGLQAEVQTGGTTNAIATVTNRGSVITSGGRSGSSAAHGIYSRNDADGTARADNGAGASVMTSGTGAIGVYVESGGGNATATNSGTVATSGEDADGISVKSRAGGMAQASNAAGATVTTSGLGAKGIYAVSQGGQAIARNDGAVTVSGDGAANGVMAFASGTDAGNVTVFNSGNVIASGADAIGLLALTEGDATAVISMSGGSVVAGATKGIGILGRAVNGSIRATIIGGAITAATVARFEGRSVSFVVRDSTLVGDVIFGDGSSTDTAAFRTGTLALAQQEVAVTQSFALSNSTLNGNLILSGNNNYALMLTNVTLASDVGPSADSVAFAVNGNITSALSLNADASRANGDMAFGGNNDSLTLYRVDLYGNVDFGAGEDTLTFDISSGNSGRITGDISNLETLVKRGAGAALVNNVAFSGSNVDIHEGRLVISGHLNVGSGTVTVNNGGENTGQLAALIASETNLPQITAGMIAFTGNADIYMQAANTELASFAQTAASGLLTNTGMIMSAGNVADTVMLRSETSSGSSSAIGSIAFDGDARTATVSGTVNVDTAFSGSGGSGGGSNTTNASGGSSNNATGFIIGGGVLAALAYYFDWFDWASTEAASLASYNGSAGGEQLGALMAGANTVHTRRAEQNGLQFWSRTHSDNSPTFAGGSRATVRAYALGINAALGDGFSIGVSAMPDMTASVSNAPGLYSGGISGDRYAINGAWQGERLFANAGFSYGDYNAHSVFDNAIGGGSLSGNFGMTHEHLRLGIGARLEIAGIRAVPRLSLFDGVAKQAAYTATGAVLYAEIPAIQQRYRGWKVGMSLSPSGWFGSSRTILWRPNLHLSAIGSHSQGGVVSVRQSDANGILSFTSPARISQMPRSILGFATSILAVRSDVWQLRVGYAGAIADDQLQHGAVASFRLRF